MSHATTYTITFDELSRLADIACQMDDRNVINGDHLRMYYVRAIHAIVMGVMGPDKSLIYDHGGA